MGSGTEVVVCPFESGVGGDVQGDVKVAVWSTVGALSAFACQFDALSVGDSCRDGDAEFAVEHLDDAWLLPLGARVGVRLRSLVRVRSAVFCVTVYQIVAQRSWRIRCFLG